MKKACNSSNQSLQLIYEIKNMIFTTNKKILYPFTRCTTHLKNKNNNPFIQPTQKIIIYYAYIHPQEHGMNKQTLKNNGQHILKRFQHVFSQFRVLIPIARNLKLLHSLALYLIRCMQSSQGYQILASESNHSKKKNYKDLDLKIQMCSLRPGYSHIYSYQ